MPKFLSNIQAEKTVAIDFIDSTNSSHKLYWDDFNGTLSLDMGGGVIQQIGQEQLSEGRNSTASTILNGTVVMITGSVGESGRLTIAPSISNGTIHSREIIGIATEDILVGEDGIITSFGLVRNIPISMKPVGETWVAGQRIYTNPTLVGKMTNIEPSAPNLKIIIGQIVYVDSEKFSIFVRLEHGSYLGGDNNVQFTELSDQDFIKYNSTSQIWENIHRTSIKLNASQIDVLDSGNYYIANNSETVFQEIGAHTNVQDSYISDLLSTGVYEFSGLVKIDNSHFSVGAAKGYIVDNTTNHSNPTITYVNYAGSGPILATNIGNSSQTQIFLDSTGSLSFSTSDQPTCPDRRDKIFLGRVVHPSTVITAVEGIPDFVQSPTSQLRDLWKGIGPINDKNYVYSNNTPSTNLSLALHGGTIYYNGINFVNNAKRPTRRDVNSQSLLTFGYRLQNGTGNDVNTVLDPTKYDNAGVLTNIAAVPHYSTNQRVYLTPVGNILIQYGQQVYSTLAEAIAGVAIETFNRAPAIEYNAILIGVISIRRGATDLTSSNAKFHGVSKFGEIGGGGAGAGAAVAAQDVAIIDAGNYFTNSHVEGALQELSYNLTHLVVGSTEVTNSSLINVTNSTLGSVTTYTVSHADPAPDFNAGNYGTDGIKSISVDSFGHITNISTDTYLTSQSKDFGTIIISDNDTGYTWSNSGSIVANSIGDTFTLVSDGGIDINIDSTAYAIQISHKDTSSQGNVAYTNSSFVQSLNFDIYGHVISANSGTLQANDLLASIKTVDGPSSGLEADLLDGQHGSYYAPAMVSVLTKATGTYSLTNEYAILGNAVSGSVILNLPAASSYNGKTYKIKKVDSSSNVITLNGSGTDKIDGQSSYSINYQYQAIELVCDGLAWYIM